MKLKKLNNAQKERVNFRINQATAIRNSIIIEAKKISTDKEFYVCNLKAEIMAHEQKTISLYEDLEHNLSYQQACFKLQEMNEKISMQNKTIDILQNQFNKGVPEPNKDEKARNKLKHTMGEIKKMEEEEKAKEVAEEKEVETQTGVDTAKDVPDETIEPKIVNEEKSDTEPAKEEPKTTTDTPQEPPVTGA